ncbi:hypothetical protein HBI37_130850 [Parastagonospora nodorum]|nr:hypothetical protein HBH43_157510 [Parastagonospora nodorum]KAH4197517.1 hypothetical protein HBH42_058380 [Parastagonospora nodorum]KAH5390435.1 hypothetical protein HBI33_025440 [Parastagonospora nodorum]KAH5459929.1 hypothetical protein HBI30_045250 [Parastagonospora nodorum]KAH6034604.1 hypothetical protein HBI83_006460 [Parastagonospora nodorum]
MHQPASERGTLDQLQTPEQVALLDTIDELRSQGLGHHGISLPQLVVCGDQSSGKSSLLEGLTRLRFPTDAGCCTSFATEVVLRRDTKVEISVEITPSTHRSDEECRALGTFKHVYSTAGEFDFLFLHEEAQKMMAGGVTPAKGTFFDDVLRVRYSGPDLPSFTIVDLPGLFKYQNGGGDGVQKVANIVTRYIQDEKAIILAVVSAMNDVENQHTFNYLDQHDPKRQRTIGIITKPDMAPRGSNQEKTYLRLAKNEEIPMRYYWHTVRNRTFEEKSQSDAERDERETQFFNDGPWTSIPRKHVGIVALREKLSRVLLEHISMELPSLVLAVQSAAESTKSSLKLLGNTRETTREQRAYLTGHAEKFQMLTNDALNGKYIHPLFAVKILGQAVPTRLRTMVQNLSIAFASQMYQKGHTWDVVSDQTCEDNAASFQRASEPDTQQRGSWSGEPIPIEKAEFLGRHIGGYVSQSRGPGLPSLVNYSVIGEVFRDQSRNWSKIAKHYLQQVFRAVRVYIDEVLSSLLDPRTHSLLMLRQIQPELERRWQNLETKLEELLVPYTEQDPTIYDPGFLRDLMEMRASRNHARNQSQPQAGHHSFTFGQDGLTNAASNSSQRLLRESLDDFTNSEIFSLMQSYYKSAISVFINNTAVLAVENCLIKDLTAIFSPTLTANMDDEQLHDIAAESEEVQYERETLRKKLEVLQSGKRTLDEHIAMRPTTRIPAPKLTKETRPHTPVPQVQQQATGITEEAFQHKMNDSLFTLNGLAVTPPPSGPNSRQPSRGRHDSIHGTPAFTGSAKKPSPRRWSPPVDLFGPEAQAESDGEL